MDKSPYKLKLGLAIFLIVTAIIRSLDFNDRIFPTPEPPSPIKVTQDSLVIVRELNDPPENEVIEDLSSIGESRKWLEEYNVRFRIIDPDQETVTGDQWVHEALQIYKEKGENKKPWMIYMDTDNRFLIGLVPPNRIEFKKALEGYVSVQAN